MSGSFHSQSTTIELITPEKEKGSYHTLLDKIICDYGYKQQIWKIIICIILVYLNIGFSGTIFATLLTAYTNIFQLSDSNISLIGCLYFILKALGALLAGHLTNKIIKSRIILIITCSYIIFSANLILAISMNKYILFAERIISGMVSGILEPLANNLLCEYLPIKFRGFTLLAVWIGYTLGQLYPNLIMIWTMPRYELTGITKTLLICSALQLICVIICSFFLYDSPRNYILHNKEEKAFGILERMNGNEKLTQKQKNYIIKETKDGVNKDLSSVSILEIFKSDYRALIIIVSFLSFIFDLVYDGGVLIMSLTLKSVEDNDTYKYLLRDEIIVILIAVPSSLIGGLCLEYKRLGRRKTIFMSFLLLIMANSFSLLFVDYMFVFLGFYLFFANYGSIMMTVYASEVFPSKIRDYCVGLTVFSTHVGSAASQFIFLYLRVFKIYAPYYFAITCCMIGCFVSCFLSVETYERPLDVSNSREETELEDKSKNLQLSNVL